MKIGNEPCSLCNQCEEIEAGLNRKIISIADARLYNIRYGMDRKVAYGLFKALRYYKEAVHNICEGNTCDFCYGQDLESILERARILTS